MASVPQYAGEVLKLTARYSELFKTLRTYKNEEEAKTCTDELNSIAQRLEQIRVENLKDE